MEKEIKKQLQEKFEDFTNFLHENEIPSFILVEIDKEACSVMLNDPEELASTWENITVYGEDDDLSASLQSLQTLAILETCSNNPKFMKSLHDTLEVAMEHKSAFRTLFEPTLKSSNREVN